MEIYGDTGTIQPEYLTHPKKKFPKNQKNADSSRLISTKDEVAKTDDELVSLFCDGQVEAFHELYHRHSGRIFSFMLALGGTWQDNEDSAQATWEKVIDRLYQYKGHNKFQSWLYRIAHNTWLDRVRSAWHRKRVLVGHGVDEDFMGLPIDTTLTQEANTVFDNAVENEKRVLLYEALQELPDRMRQTVMLYIDGEMTFQEISECMDCPIGTTYWRFRRAERLMQEKFSE